MKHIEGLGPMTVERVHTDTGSYIEPPIDPHWSEEDKLRWKAAVASVDSGIRVEVQRKGRDSLLGPMLYDLTYESGACGDYTSREISVLLTGFAIGAKTVRNLER